MSPAVSTRCLGLEAVGIDDRTIKAVGENVMEKLRSLSFCVVGCGGTGANFAEMIVRSGGRRIVLIDGDRVDDTNLNRVFGFSFDDVELPKVEALSARLMSIRPRSEVETLSDHFRERENIANGYVLGQRVRDAVYDADVVFIGTDTNRSRIAVEDLCRAKTQGMYLSCGVVVDRTSGVYAFECNWSPKTPLEYAEQEGYGPEGASFVSIVQEATSVAFTMLISHLTCADCEFKSYVKVYDSVFRPTETIVNGKSSGKRLWCSDSTHE